jgi:hypothetical protein
LAKGKRVEVLFDPREYRVLEDAAHRDGKSVGHVIREAVAKYVVIPAEATRERALGDFLSIAGGPVGSPEEMKEDILRGYDEDDERLYETD